MHLQQADLIIEQITAILAHSLYVNGTILTGNRVFKTKLGNWQVMDSKES